HTRGGWAAAGRAGAGGAAPGDLVVGAPAHLAVWRVPQGTAGPGGVLPALRDDEPLPECVRTVRAGAVLHDALG
ncbi:MAG: hydrolase, partial [Cellulomonas sp.]